MLLTFEDYKDKFGGIKVTDEIKYNALESDAEDLFNIATHMFYVENNIEDDPDQERANLFKKALKLQIDYTSDLGASTSYEIADKSVKSTSIDGTNITLDSTAADQSHDGIYNLAWAYLLETGLLYAGVPVKERGVFEW